MRFLLLFLSAACAMMLRAQAPYWATRAGGPGVERIADVKVGIGDAVFAVGHFTAGATVDGEGLVSQGSLDVFVMKQDALGVVQWIVTGGGPGIDLGAKVQPLSDGGLLVCGQFSGVADLFGIPVSANGGSTDMFVARLNGMNGSALWVRTGGSASFTDRATGVAVAPDGRVLVSGEFRGNAAFDAGTFNSVVDPGTNLPGADIFLASFDANGTAQWLKHGMAKYDDAAADVVSDAIGNAYLLGQYSDTVQFDLQHPNTGLNQGALAKFDPLGNEVWFRRIGGAAYQHMADLHMSDDGALLVCGDAQGSLTFFDDQPNVIASTDPFAYFLLKVTLAGDLMSGATEGSGSAVTASALHQSGTDIHVLGSFECQFTALAAHYNATGLFIANGQPDLFIARHASNGLGSISAQQFGGHQLKVPGGISALSNGAVIFSGSFEELLIFPGDAGGWGESFPCPLQACEPDTICGDVHYNDYEAIQSAGIADGFVARGLVLGREPYDNWCRTDDCDRSAWPIQIVSSGQINDTLLSCGIDTLRWEGSVPRPSIGCPSGRTISWDLGVSWSTGASIDSIYVTQSDDYTVSVFSSNGCFLRTDQIHEEILPAPLAWVLIEGTTEPFAGAPEDLCTALSICTPRILTAVNVPPGATATWSVNGDVVPGMSVLADTDGEYVLTVVADNGCLAINCVNIDLMQSVELPNITDLVYSFVYDGVPLSQEDTVVFCSEGCVQGLVELTWYANGQLVQLEEPYYLIHGLANDCGQLQNYLGDPVYWSQMVNGAGWYPLNMHLIMHVEGCSNDSLVFNISDSVFIVPIEPPVIIDPDTTFMCAGDTALLVLDCGNCELVEWSGPGLISVSTGSDSAWVNAVGFYSVIASNSDLGVECIAAAYYQVAIAQPPQLVIEPPGGLVCPGQPALIHTPFASAIYEWTGPSGPLSINNDSISVTEFGSYFLTTYTASGCALFNGPVNVQQFSTPALQFVPDDVLCPGETALLQVQGGNIEQLVWGPPLSGADLVQYIATPGTYSCVVTSCGVEVELFATLVADPISVSIPAGPYAFCPGGSVLLDGPTTTYQYLWIPGNATTEDLLVTASGQYQLQVTDSLGCVALSDLVEVNELSFTLSLTAQGDSVCPEENALLTAIGSGSIEWYADADLQQPLITGDSLSITMPSVGDTVFVVQTENGCTSPPVSVHYITVAGPLQPLIMGDTTICAGDALLLSVLPQVGASYQWTTPQGALQGPIISIAQVSSQDGGQYTCTATIASCPGSQSSVMVMVISGPAAPTISGSTALCLGDELVLGVPLVPGISYAWTTPQGQLSGNVVQVNEAVLDDAGAYICVPFTADCPGVPAQVEVTIQLPPPDPMMTGPVALCEGDDATLTVSGVGGAFTWVFPNGSFPGTGPSISLAGLAAANSGSYGVLVEGGVCDDASAFIQIIIDPCEIIIPNVITPNGDGNNDLLFLEAPVGSTYAMTIHNRWGQPVWSMSGSVLTWNGNNDRREPLPDGVYFYVFMRSHDHGELKSTGYIHVLRQR